MGDPPTFTDQRCILMGGIELPTATPAGAASPHRWLRPSRPFTSCTPTTNGRRPAGVNPKEPPPHREQLRPATAHSSLHVKIPQRSSPIAQPSAAQSIDLWPRFSFYSANVLSRYLRHNQFYKYGRSSIFVEHTHLSVYFIDITHFVILKIRIDPLEHLINNTTDVSIISDKIDNIFFNSIFVSGKFHIFTKIFVCHP